MKKIVLFAAAMVFCAGLAFAQQPAKANTNANTNKEVKSEKKSCGHCPHHAKCANDAAAVKGNKETATVKSDDKKGCCNNDTKQPAKPKKNDNKAATKK